jgi:hypothetical protein
MFRPILSRFHSLSLSLSFSQTRASSLSLSFSLTHTFSFFLSLSLSLFHTFTRLCERTIWAVVALVNSLTFPFFLSFFYFESTPLSTYTFFSPSLHLFQLFVCLYCSLPLLSLSIINLFVLHHIIHMFLPTFSLSISLS